MFYAVNFKMASSEESLLEAVVQIDPKKFTDTERDLILQVVARDEEIRRQEKSRIEYVFAYTILVFMNY